VRGDPHAGFCESRGVRFPPATHLRLAEQLGKTQTALEIAGKAFALLEDV